MNPPYQSPVYQIRRVPLDQIRSNAYNPNSVAPPEMKLLYQSIKEDGYTMPIVCYQLEDGTYEIVDGFHRCQIMKTYRDIYEREDGMMPVAVIDKPLGNRMASTIRTTVPWVSQYRTDDQHYPGTDGSGHVGCVDTQKPRHGRGGVVAPQAAQRHCGPVPGRRIQPGVGIEITSTRETMNKYVTQLLEVIQKKTGCDTSGAVRWLAEQAGVSERTAWNWKQQEKLRKATEKNLGRIAEELKK